MSNRAETQLDRIANGWVSTLVEHNPTIGTYIGRSEADPFLPDYSPEKTTDFLGEKKRTKAELERAEPQDLVDKITQADLAAELELEIKMLETGEHLRDLNVIASPAQEIRDIFDLMPTETSAQWETIARRMRAVPASIDSYITALREGVLQSKVPALRQVTENIAQAKRNAADFFTNLVAKTNDFGVDISETLVKELSAEAQKAQAAYARFGEFLGQEIAPHAPAKDAFGRERYELYSEAFLGLKADLDETYEWGIEELKKVAAEQEAVAAEILGFDSVKAASVDNLVELAVAKLEKDASKKLYGTKNLQEWMQQVSDRAVAELGETQFDIPQEIRTLECMIAPNNEGGIYYTGPSDDFSRPGRMWWSVPEGVTEFDTWRELTTVYHEGVPGHHLQIGQAVVNRHELNEWRRQLAGTSGHAEGWALYAERLMQELGYLDDPADRLGMLDGQRMRAARVVLDIGVHLEKKIPGEDRLWDAEHAFNFMRQNVNMNEGFIRFEVNRYLGWAGQAPSYKIGQRIFEELRAEAEQEAKEKFDVREFHRQTLAIGGVRLDTLQKVLRGEI